MRLLNQDRCSGDGHNQYESRPEAVEFCIRGRRFVLDALGLALYEVDGQDDQFPLATRTVQAALPAMGLQAVVLHNCVSCNMACSYCFVRDTPGVQLMSMEVLEKFIRQFFPLGKETPQKISFAYFGGEPLLNFGFIEQSVEFLQTYFGGNATFGLTTNGTLIDEKVARFMAAFKFNSIIYSLDGAKEIHDKNRKSLDGQGTFDRAMGGLELLKVHRLASVVTLRATFTKQDTQIVERLKFLNELADNGYARDVSVEPVDSCHAEAEQAGSDFSLNDESALLDEYLSAADYLVERSKAGKPMRFATVMNFVDRLKERRHNWSNCGAGRGYLSLMPDGQISACHRFRHTLIGDIGRGGIDEGRAAKWFDNRVYARGGCMGCGLRLLCGGGCRERSAANGDIAVPDPVGCMFTRLCVKSAVWVMANIG